MDIAETKRNVRGWLSGRPLLLEAVFRLLGKPYAEISLFRSLVRKGDVVFDVGANTGQYLCLFSRLVGREGAVHAFEPIPQTFAMMEANAARHARFSPVFLNNVAVGEKKGSITMAVSDGRFTEASMVPGGSVPDARVERFEDIPVVALDGYAREKGVEDISLIKCDVEGAEMLAMKGAAGILKRKKPPILFLEAWSEWTERFGYRPPDLFSFLEKEGGYEIYHIYRDGMKRIAPSEELPPDFFPDFLNFLCVVPSVHSDRLAVLGKNMLAPVR